MGCVNTKKIKMSKGLHEQLLKAFNKLDTRSSQRISRQEMDQYWTGPYTKTYTQVLFKQIDMDGNGVISKDEWIAYWELALRAGYSEDEIRECIKSIKGGKLQMQFSRVRNYEPAQNRTNLVQDVIEEIGDEFA